MDLRTYDKIDRAYYSCISIIIKDRNNIKVYPGMHVYIYENGRWCYNSTERTIITYNRLTKCLDIIDDSRQVVIMMASMFRGDLLRYVLSIITGWIDNDKYFGLGKNSRFIKIAKK